jgi:hypothetical protein
MGFLALAGVAVAVGLVLGVVGIFASHAAGVGGESVSDAGASLYLPTPSETGFDIGGVVLPTGSATPSESGSSSPSTSTEPSESTSPSESSSPSNSPSKPAKQTSINLTASPTTVSPMGNITLTGTYPNGEGEIVQVQRKQGGAWVDFPVPGVAVTGGRFSTYIQTGQPGAQLFRVIDTSNHQTSNTVTVTVS